MDVTPRWRGARAAGGLLLGATGLGLLFGSRTYLLYNAYPDNSISLADALVPSLTDWYLWALFVPAIIWASRWRSIDAGSWRTALAFHLAFGVAVALGRYGVDMAAGSVLPWMPARGFSRTAVIFDFYPNVLTYWVLVLAVHAVDFGRRSRDRALEASYRCCGCSCSPTSCSTR